MIKSLALIFLVYLYRYYCWLLRFQRCWSVILFTWFLQGFFFPAIYGMDLLLNSSFLNLQQYNFESLILFNVHPFSILFLNPNISLWTICFFLQSLRYWLFGVKREYNLLEEQLKRNCTNNYLYYHGNRRETQEYWNMQKLNSWFPTRK